ncbi:tRNA lysidine(34) synthetase TilS [Pasteurellaceae bacterium LIM206]|nr:tRNA lysidine(34) synthetase TilS [Pasteurellaceae bacterium LIM206]
MTDLFRRFQQRIHHQKLLIAFSGGLDSTALLSLCVKLRKITPHLQLRAIHIHHGISPNADVWTAHCKQYCATLNVPLIVERVRIEDKTNGIEAGARAARYAAIGKHRHADEIVVTAHHLNDQAETFLLALKRGSGVQGLSAMQRQSAVLNLPVLRPLLDFSRAELEQYVRDERLNWIEDESNADNTYDRNFLRNEILPLIRRRWAFFDTAVARSAQHCFEQQQLINELLKEEFQQNYQIQHRTFAVDGLKSASVNKQKALLRMWLQANRIEMPSQTQLEQLIQDVIQAAPDRNPQFKLGRHIVRRYRQHLYLTPELNDVSRVRLPLIPGDILHLPDSLGQLELVKTDSGFEAIWQTDDHRYRSRLLPTKQPISVRFGYSGTVKLHRNSVNQDIKKVWQQLAVPPWLRRRVPLIFYGERLQSAVGFFEVFHGP